MAKAQTALYHQPTPGGTAGRLVLYALLLVGAAFFLLPFLWMLSTAFKPPWQVMVFPPQWIPAELHWANFTDSWGALDFDVFYRNTVLLTLVNIVGTLLSTSLVAFAFARLRFRGRDVLFLVLISTMMLPSQVTLIPMYVFFARLDWINTFWPLIVPVWLAGGPNGAFNVFLLRQFFLTIPRDLDDAAKMDGANFFDLYWRLILPISLPALGIITIFTFTNNWNDFFNPLIYINTTDKYTVALALRFYQTRLDVQMGPLMAQSLVALLPVLVVFFFAQKRYVQGIVITGVKG
jgi:ABC-type glycerol-3-phosphate transport system permease component